MTQAIANDRTKEWHVARTKGVGASEAAAVCGLSQYETAFDVWARKTGRVANKESTPVMELGTYCEPFLFDHIHSTHPISHRSPGLFRHKDHEIVLASPDAILEDGRGLETKVTSDLNKDIGDEPDALPGSWILQAQQQIAVCDLPAVVFAVAVLPHGIRDFLLESVGATDAARVIAKSIENGSVPVRTWTIDRHQKLIDGMIRTELKFWQHVETDTPPEIDLNHARACEGVKAAYRNAVEGKEVDLGDELHSLWQQRQHHKAVIKDAEAEVKKIDAQIYLSMQDAAVGTFPNGERVRKVLVNETFVPGFTRKASSYLKGAK